MDRRILTTLGSVVAATGLAFMTPLAGVAQNAPSAPHSSESEAGTLQEVVVTAQRREETMVDVPISIAAIDAQQLSTANIQGRFTVALYGNNITNIRYRTSIQVTGNGVGATWNAPIAWGIQLGAKL
jgi:outer membrane receptor protein involved in Fe transport